MNDRPHPGPPSMGRFSPVSSTAHTSEFVRFLRSMASGSGASRSERRVEGVVHGFERARRPLSQQRAAKRKVKGGSPGAALARDDAGSVCVSHTESSLGGGLGQDPRNARPRLPIDAPRLPPSPRQLRRTSAEPRSAQARSPANTVQAFNARFFPHANWNQPEKTRIGKKVLANRWKRIIFSKVVLALGAGLAIKSEVSD